MCGICGIVAPGRPPEADTVEAMARELDHRGPDGPGSFAAEGVALGFRRLAIIDLSDAGDQPFASEPRAFRADPSTRLEPNPRAVREYLEQAYLDHTEETFFAGIRKLRPAHSLVFDEDGLRLRRYWRLEPHDPPAGDPAEAVVEQTRAEPHWISFADEELVDDLPRIVEAQGEPFGSTSICAGWYVMREAKRSGLTVMLDGQGGDEVLAGYRAHLGHRLADLLAQGRLAELRAELAGFSAEHSPAALVTALSRPFAPELVTRIVRARTRGSATLVHPDLRGVPAAEASNGSPFPDRLRRHQQLILTRRGLPELLRYEDRNSMAHSLEARVPFLDYRLVELCFSLPGGELVGGGQTKAVLRRALGDLLPPLVRERRDKLGFVTPQRAWLRGSLGELAGDVFASRSFAERGFVDAAAARRRLERHRTGRLEAGMELWRALNLELWARAFL